MDSSDSHSIVHTVCDYIPTDADLQHSQRWFHEKRSARADWRPICGLLLSNMHLAHNATRFTFYQTEIAKANHTDSVDGAHLCNQCGTKCAHYLFCFVFFVSV